MTAHERCSTPKALLAGLGPRDVETHGIPVETLEDYSEKARAGISKLQKKPHIQADPEMVQTLQEYLDFNKKMSLSDIPNLRSYLEERVSTLSKNYISLVFYNPNNY